jgi:hypothetical protein
MKTCTACGQLTPLQDYYVSATSADGRRWHCKGCERRGVANYLRTVRGSIVAALSSGRRRARQRSHSFSLTVDNVLDMLWFQQGRCYYSGVPMEHKIPNSHWRMSLERLSNDEGYSIRNCVLVASEFNSSDYSRNKSTFAVHGTAQWTRAKVEMVWGPWNISKLRPS